MLQKHNFPINYTVRVHHQEVFKLSNISKMVSVLILLLESIFHFSLFLSGEQCSSPLPLLEATGGRLGRTSPSEDVVPC